MDSLKELLIAKIARVCKTTLKFSRSYTQGGKMLEKNTKYVLTTRGKNKMF